MSGADLGRALLWAADHLDEWRNYGIAALAVLALAALSFASALWEGER